MSSESDESDHIGFLGEQSDSERSDASAESDGAGALFDLEAADSDDHPSDDDDDDSDDHHDADVEVAAQI